MQVPRLIELIGVPGSGKTTVAHLLCQELETLGMVPLTLPDAGRIAARRTWLGGLIPGPSTPLGEGLAWKLFEVERLMRGMWFLLVRPRLAFLLTKLQFGRPRSARDGRRVMHWWIRAVGARSLLLSQRRDREVVVLDEGLCHRVVQLFSSTEEVPDSSDIERYASEIVFPDLLIHVVAPAETSYERVIDRGIWERMSDEDPIRVQGFLRNAALAISHLLDSEGARDAGIVDVDNSAEVPPLGIEIVSQLRSEGFLA